MGRAEGEVKVIQVENEALVQDGKIFPFFLSYGYILTLASIKCSK